MIFHNIKPKPLVFTDKINKNHEVDEEMLIKAVDLYNDAIVSNFVLEYKKLPENLKNRIFEQIMEDTIENKDELWGDAK